MINVRVQKKTRLICNQFCFSRTPVYRLAYNGDVAAGQFAVFQAASETPISELIRSGPAAAGRKNSQLAVVHGVALKMGRRLRCSSVTSRTIFILQGKEPNNGSIKMVRDAPSYCQSG